MNRLSIARCCCGSLCTLCDGPANHPTIKVVIDTGTCLDGTYFLDQGSGGYECQYTLQGAFACGIDCGDLTNHITVDFGLNWMSVATINVGIQLNRINPSPTLCMIIGELIHPDGWGARFGCGETEWEYEVPISDASFGGCAGDCNLDGVTGTVTISNV